MSRPLVVGVGNPDRGDDAIGPHVAARVAALGVPGVDVVERREPLDLVEDLLERDHVVIVDASAPAGRPGLLQVHAVGEAALSPGVDAAGGTHGFGVTEAVELARALGRLPPRLVLIGVEAGALQAGQPLSAAVSSRVDDAVRATLTAAAP
jgi:hydrogenase maturation protease